MTNRLSRATIVHIYLVLALNQLLMTEHNHSNAAQYPDDALAENAALDTINTHDATTLDELFRERVRRSPEKVAYSQFDALNSEWRSYSWAQIAEQVERWQVAFRESGLQKGDRVAICYLNSIEWVIFDQAALRLGLVVVPLYTADRADNIAYVIANAGAKLVLFAQRAMWNAVAASDEDTSCLEQVLVFKDLISQPNNPVQNKTHAKVTLVDEWLPEHGAHLERGLAEPDDLASIVYTSGTTGRPKGVMLSHKNMLSNAYSGMRSVALTPQDTLLSFLPLSHTFERTIGYYAALMSGSQVAFNRSIPQLSEDLLNIKPTVMVSVPRIFERVHNKIQTELTSKSRLEQWLFKTAIKVGWHKFMRQQGQVNWHPCLLTAPFLDTLVAKKIRKKLGGRLQYVVIGGAPLTQEVGKTFIALGLPLLQGYGLTESSPVVSVNTVDNNRLGTIGLLLRGVSVKIEDNDELWIKGDNVMQGYWQNSEATDKNIIIEGDERWLRSGDRASIDKDGFVRIIGRIKDILVLANGEKVPPPDIEAAIARNPLFEQVMVVGEGKAFLTLLVYPEPELLAALCEELGVGRTVVDNPKLHKRLIKLVSEQMGDFPGYAKIRKIHICDEEWTVESGLLTPTLKLKRAKVLAHFEPEIEAMYKKHRGNQ